MTANAAEMGERTDAPPPSDLYAQLLDLVERRLNAPTLQQATPIPEAVLERVLELARLTPSTGNAQPWDFIVVTDGEQRRELSRVYREVEADFLYWMEQQRAPELRHPGLDMDPEVFRWGADPGWGEVPVLVAVSGDGRRQWGAVWAAHTFGRHQSDLTDSLANATLLLQLGAGACGLASRATPIRVEDPFKEALGVPDGMTLHSIVALGYPAADGVVRSRRAPSEVIHRERFDPSKSLTNEQVLDWLRQLRASGGE